MLERKELPEVRIFKKVLIHCLAIIVFPVTSFFVSKIFIFDALSSVSSISSNVYAAVVAVLVLHVAVALLIYRACFDTPEKIQAKTD